MRIINTYNRHYLAIQGTADPDLTADKYRSPEYRILGDGRTYLRFSTYASAKYQQAAAFVYWDMMGGGVYEPDPIEMAMFVETVWDLPDCWTNKEMATHLEELARELDRFYGVDLWWTFNPTLRFEI